MRRVPVFEIAPHSDQLRRNAWRGTTQTTFVTRNEGNLSVLCLSRDVVLGIVPFEFGRDCAQYLHPVQHTLPSLEQL